MFDVNEVFWNLVLRGSRRKDMVPDKTFQRGRNIGKGVRLLCRKRWFWVFVSNDAREQGENDLIDECISKNFSARLSTHAES